MREGRNPVDFGRGRSEAKPVHPLQCSQFPVDGRACHALLMALIDVAGDEIAGHAGGAHVQ